MTDTAPAQTLLVVRETATERRLLIAAVAADTNRAEEERVRIDRKFVSGDDPPVFDWSDGNRGSI